MPSEGSTTVDKAMRVLELLRQRGTPVGLGDIARDVQVPKSTAHRLLTSLSAHELVEASGDGSYALGMGLVRLGLGSLSRDPVAHVAKRELELAAREFGQAFFLVAARAGRLWIMERAEGQGMLRAVPELGVEVDVAQTASGRLYLAHAPELLEVPARRGSKLATRVEQARRQGYDINDGEWIDGLLVVAAPILAADRMYGCVACAGARQSLSGRAQKDAVQHTQELAARIASALSGGPSGQRRST